MRLLVILLLFFSQSVYSQLKPALEKKDIGPKTIEMNLEHKKIKPAADVEEFDYTIERTFDLKSMKEQRFEVKSWDDGRPIFIKGRLEESALTANVEEQGRVYLHALSDILYIDDTDAELVLVESKEDEIGMTHLKYNQHYKGIPVLGGQFILHEKNGMIKSANGFTYPTPEVQNLEAGLTREQVKEIITTDEPEKTITARQSRFIPQRWNIEQVIYHPDRNVPEALLAYHVEYFSSMIDRWIYVIDASSGAVLEKYSGVCKLHNHGIPAGTEATSVAPPGGPATSTDQDLLGINRTINTYGQTGQFFMIDASRPMYSPSPQGLFESEGLIVTLDAQNTSPQGNFNFTDITSSNNNWNDRTSVSAHFNAGTAYEYFRQTHNRNSINGQGGNIISLIHVADENGQPMDNAFWNGAAMFYGDGNQAFFPLARGLDVAGHEISHGVVQSTANLVYQGESGAMNESFSDVFGAMIDREDWQMGEDVVNPQFFPSGALRDLEDPHNGAAQGDFNGGFQPKHVNEMFTGSADNGGVHINSGIPNHAYYLFATAVGRDRAEQVWYRALDTYLTASSRFIDLRIAAVQAAGDLYGNAEIQAVENAMDQVGIFDGEGGEYQEDIDINEGEDFLLMTDINRQDIFIANLTTNDVLQISDKDPISKPSITDDGTEIVFIGSDNLLHYILLEWDGNQLVDIQESILEDTPVWRNIVISRDGSRVAGLFDDLDPTLWVFDFNVGASNEFTLFNPTTANDGSTTGEVQYADALEFDFTGNWVMYDAFNRVTGTGGSSLEYWDIGFLRIWNEEINSWSLGEVNKLFSSLPTDVSIGNPTFSKNSNYVIAFDFIQDGQFAMLGYNLETNEDGLMREHDGPGFPSFSRLDDELVYDDFTTSNIGGLGLSVVSDSKITGGQHQNLSTDFRWPRWFGNGDRATSSTVELETVLTGLNIYPNPTAGNLTIDFESEQRDQMLIEIFDLLGKKVYSTWEPVAQGQNQIRTNLSLNAGQYLLKLKTQGKQGASVITVAN